MTYAATALSLERDNLWFQPLAYLYGIRIIPFIYVDNYAHVTLDRVKVEFGDTIPTSSCFSGSSNHKKKKLPPIPSLIQLDYFSKYSKPEFLPIPELIENRNNPTILRHLLPPYSNLEDYQTNLIETNGNPCWDIPFLDCPMHIVIYCRNPLQSQVKPNGIKRSVEPITTEQYNHFKQHIPALYKAQLLRLIYPFQTFEKMDKLDALWNVHFIVDSEWDSLLADIQQKAVDARIDLLKAKMNSQP